MFSARWILKIWLILILFLSGCGGQQTLQENDPSQSDSIKGHIFIWKELPSGASENNLNAFVNITKNSLEEFAQLNPGTKITIRFIPAGKAMPLFWKESARGAGPNLLWLPFAENVSDLVEQGRLQSLEPFKIDLSLFVPESLNQVSYGGEMYGIPTNLETQILCYNKEKVKQLPNTLSDVVEQARSGYSVGLHSGFSEAFWGTGIFSSSILNEEEQFIAGKAWAQWIEWLKKASNEPNVYFIDNPEELQGLFAENKLAYITCWSNWLPLLTEKMGENALGVTVLPHATNRPATPPLLTDVLFFNRASSPQQTQLALKLALFLVNAEQQKKNQIATPFTIPVNRNVKVDRRLYPFQAILQDQSHSAVALNLNQSEKLADNLKELNLLYRKFLAGEISSDQAEAEVTKIINESIWQDNNKN